MSRDHQQKLWRMAVSWNTHRRAALATMQFWDIADVARKLRDQAMMVLEMEASKNA